MSDLAPRTMRALAAMRPLRAACECGNDRFIQVADKHLDMLIEHYARALRCSTCNRKGQKTLIGTITQPRNTRPVVSLWDHPEAMRRPKRKASMLDRGFGHIDARQIETIKALYPDIEERIAEEDRWRAAGKLARALIGWANEDD